MSGSQHTEGATAGREVLEVNRKGDTNAIAAGDSRDGALDIATGIAGVEELRVREGCGVDDSGRIVLDYGGIAKGTSDDGITGSWCGLSDDES